MDFNVLKRVDNHYQESKQYFPEDRIVGIFLQGSQNYGLQTPVSDVDTKLIVVPTFNEIAFNQKPQSTTHVRANNEHIDFKDLRLMLQTFRKQNLNFLEILFTEYRFLNTLYQDEWGKLTRAREDITHYNLYLAVKAMRGIAYEKYYAMEHLYPSKVKIIEEYGYDPKQLHHLLRVSDYLDRYIAGEPYEQCLRPSDPEMLIAVKLGALDLDAARETADKTLEHINSICEPFTKDSKYNESNPKVDCLLDEVQYNIMKKAISLELGGK